MAQERGQINKVVQDIFFDQSDVIRTDTGERALSLKKFVSVIIENNLFSRETQNKFASEFVPDKEVDLIFFFYLKFYLYIRIQ